MGTAKKRIRPQRQLSLSNECWEILTEMSEGSENEKTSRSKVIEVLAQFARDLTLDETATCIANKLRVRLGMPPLENENRSYRDIVKGEHAEE